MGLLGKIFAVIGIIILIILLIAGITAWQAYSLVKTAMAEGTVISKDVSEISSKGPMLTKDDCAKVSEIEASAQKIKAKAESSCKNPIIRIAVDNMQQVAIKCQDIPTLESQMTQGLVPIKAICANLTLS